MFEDRLSLLTSVASFSVTELENLLLRRFQKEPAQVADLTSLIEQLLLSRNIGQALTLLNTEEINFLSALGDGTEVSTSEQSLQNLVDLGLIADTKNGLQPLAAVTQELKNTLSTSSKEWEKIKFPLPAHSAKSWFETAFLSAQQLAVLLNTLTSSRIALNRNGQVPAALAQLFEESHGWKKEVTALLFWTVQSLAFTRVVKSPVDDTKHLELSPLGKNWVQKEHHERWVSLATLLLSLTQLLSGTPNGVLSSPPNLESVRERFPLLSRDEIGERILLLRALSHFGVAEGDEFATPTKLILEGNFDAALDYVTANFPAAVSGVIVQPDFSVVAPGPLEPSIGMKLLAISDPLTLGLASSFRISNRTIERALKRGWKIAQVQEFLDTISLTPLPQPLQFLLQEMRDIQQIEGSALEQVPSKHAPKTDWAGPLASHIWDSLHLTPTAVYAQVLEVAKKQRATVTIMIESAAKSQTLRLIPVAISNERLRARDAEREVERVIPLRSIRNISAGSHESFAVKAKVDR